MLGNGAAVGNGADDGSDDVAIGAIGNGAGGARTMHILFWTMSKNNLVRRSSPVKSTSASSKSSCLVERLGADMAPEV